MKKLIYIFLVLGLLSGMSACYKDKGNYSYSALEEIKISGLEKTYSKISRVDKIQIDPQVNVSDPAADLEYLWQINEADAIGSVPKSFTIGHEKKLDYLVNVDANTYILVFRVKNKKTGYEQMTSSVVTVITRFTRGWYVFKEEGGKSDIDLFETPTSIIAGNKAANVFSEVNGRQLDGHSMQFSYASDYNGVFNGKTSNFKAFFAFTDKDATVVNLNTFKEVRNMNTFFYDVPKVKAPGMILTGGYGKYFVNDGGLHIISTFTFNNGTFGARLMGDGNNKPYHLSKYYISHNFNVPLFFDELSSSFYSSNTFSSSLDAIDDADGTELPANNNNQKLLYMGQSLLSPLEGYAILQDKTDPAKKSIAHIEFEGELMIHLQTIKPSDKIYNATLYTLNNSDENLIYFVTADNQVWSRNLVNGVEQLQYTPPSGETVTYIRHRKYTAYTAPASEQPFKFNLIMVGTTSGGKYKVRMFEKTAGNLNANPAFVMEGDGTVSDVIYMSPSLRPSEELVWSY
ncbi:MAG: hypothetical protein J7578_17700 [Chitinophagaceae bacterium]|nr:hypothetical protein [Chitinophagaceae bacterium]